MNTQRQTAWLAAVQAKIYGFLSARNSGLWLATVSGQFLCRLPHGPRSGVGRRRHLGRAVPCTPLSSGGCWQAPFLPFPSLRTAGSDLAAFTAAAVPTSWNQPSWPCSSSKAITFLQVDIATSCPKQSCTVPLHF